MSIDMLVRQGREREALAVGSPDLPQWVSYERVFRTYFINSRGDEAIGTTWSYLDMTALGRQEIWEDSPEGYPQSERYKWWNWHDSDAPGAAPDSKWVEVSGVGEAVFRKT